MAWAAIANFVFKEVPTFTKMNQILENLKTHNHKGTDQGLRIDNQLAPASAPAPGQGTVTLPNASPNQVATLTAVPATVRNATLHMLVTQTGNNQVTWTFTGTVGALVPTGGMKSFAPPLSGTWYYFAIPLGPIAAAGDINILAASVAGTAVNVRCWVSN